MTYYLNPVDLSLYGNAILALLGAVYLHLSRDKQPETKWLYLALYFLSLTFLGWTSGFDFRSDTNLYKFFFVAITNALWGAFFVLFVYRYKDDVFPRERKIVSYVVFAVPAYTLFKIVRYFNGSLAVQDTVIPIWIASLFIIFPLFVAWRKSRAFRKNGQENYAQALKSLVRALSVWILLLFWALLVRMQDFHPNTLAIGVALLTTLFVLLLILTYIHHSGIEFSVLSKLVVVSLSGILFIMTLIIQVTLPTLDDHQIRIEDKLISQNESIHFEPTDSGGYRRHQSLSQLRFPIGSEIDIGYQEYHALDLPFSFRFYDTSHDTLYVSEYGLAKFF